ncbi:DUF1593 domain-containing protein [Rhodocytophaga rosea]|uniref:DUF1593 domain-containing protein n=1 Tax=Rhodocytophaga rosea TaxID=2704465 RepID=A0A6C0GNQ4_9BACT|nr:nucleoside hydrolase-like domain-containing protein [Rhodocytophaga rosea]QHT69669.1 DUF1593 domain-containing protein [Rhodocytophaga rosea]
MCTNFLFRQALIFFTIASFINSSCILTKKPGIKTNQTLSNAQVIRPRVIVSTDIGGSDPDDFQSMIHYLMYADKFETEGLVASPYGEGRKSHIFQMLDLYEKDYPKLKAHSPLFPTPDQLRMVTRQGEINKAPEKGWRTATEGSEWIIQCARKKSSQPLWILVWGGLEDVAQALHDAPDITGNIRVYWIGGPNKKWSVQAYQYIARNFPDLWMIESNATYRGWTIDGETNSGYDNKTFYEKYIQGKGAMGKDFGNYYQGMLKMGDSPSVGYLLSGNPDDPTATGWGGSYIPLRHSARRVFERHTTLRDEVPVFGIIEWVLSGPDRGKAIDEPCIWMEVDGQKIDGFYIGKGKYKIRFVPKEAKKWKYQVVSDAPELHGKSGGFTSTDSWPGEPHKDNMVHLHKWWSDSTAPENYLGKHQGGNTIYRWRKTYLEDWAKRWVWLSAD